MLKEQCAIATCLRNLAHKSRDNPVTGGMAVRHRAQRLVARLQRGEKAGTLSATVISCGRRHMDIHDKARVQWACRRGMLELDVSIMPFFKYEYDSLSDSDKQVFVALLKSDDPDLFNWMMNHGEPADPEFKRMVKLIQQRNRERGPVAM